MAQDKNIDQNKGGMDRDLGGKDRNLNAGGIDQNKTDRQDQDRNRSGQGFSANQDSQKSDLNRGSASGERSNVNR